MSDFSFGRIPAPFDRNPGPPPTPEQLKAREAAEAKAAHETAKNDLLTRETNVRENATPVASVGLVNDNVEIDESAEGTNKGEIMRVSAFDPNAISMLEKRAREHAGSEVIVQEGTEFVLYAVDSFKQKDITLEYMGNRPHNYITGNAIESPKTGKSQPVLELFTDDNYKATNDPGDGTKTYSDPEHWEKSKLK
jgi:hypothetical protein